MLNWFLNLFRSYERPKNTGVVDEDIRPEDFVVGANSPIVYKIRVPDGNWTSWVWSQVKQWAKKLGIYHDNLGCTGNALATLIESYIFKFYGVKKQVSRRWINKMSGTNQGKYKGIGNTIIAPVDWVRKNGFVWEEDYPTPESWTNDEYYADLSVGEMDRLAKLALENKKLFKPKNGTDCLEYEYLNITDPEIDKHLKHGLILGTIPGHQTMAFTSPKELTRYRDSYEPWDKDIYASGFIKLLKVVMEPSKIEARLFKFQDSPEVWAALPLDSMERLAFIKQNLPTWLPDYIMDENIVVLPTKKPL